MNHIRPTTQAPDLSIDLTGADHWSLSKQAPETFTMIVFYRGLHCPKCQEQLEDLNGKLDTFKGLGVNILALSMDNKETAQETHEKWDIKDIQLGYGLEQDAARGWGLFFSQKADGEVFCEPGLFLVKPDGTLYSSSVQTMPFARPHSDDIINAIKFIKQKDYAAGGSVE